MSEDIVLYTNPMSRGRTAHWMLEELGVPYRTEVLSFEKGEHKAEAYLAINPMGKVPAIVHRGEVVTEVAAICAYLADAFPEKQLAPKLDDPKRARYIRWLFFAAICFEPAVLDSMSPRVKAIPASAVGHGTLDEVLNALEKALQPGPYILGDRFSAADLYVGAQLAYGVMTKSIQPRPIFEEYIQRVTSRPSAQRRDKLCEELAAKLKQRGG